MRRKINSTKNRQINLICIFSTEIVPRVEGDVLELQKVTRSQMGEYLCIASNGYPPAVSKKVDLKVNCE